MIISEEVIQGTLAHGKATEVAHLPAAPGSKLAMAAGNIPPGTALTRGLPTRNSSEKMSQHRPQLTEGPKAYLPYQTGDPLSDHLQEQEVSLQPGGHRSLLHLQITLQKQSPTSPNGLIWHHELATKESKLPSTTATPAITINDQETVIQITTIMTTKKRVLMQPRLNQQIRETNLLQTEQSLLQTQLTTTLWCKSKHKI